MIKRKNRISYNNEGSAIITALVVGTVLMVLCLSVLAIAYSLFLSQKANTSDMPKRELLYSAVEAIEEELFNTASDATGASAYTLKLLNESGSGGEIDATAQESEFGKMILNSILAELNTITKDLGTGKYTQGLENWLCYKLDSNYSSNSDLKQCSRFFNLRSIGSVKIVAQVYWEIPKNWDCLQDTFEGTVLHIIYRLYNAENMELEVKTERVYKLGFSMINMTTSGSGASSGTGEPSGSGASSETGEPSGSGELSGSGDSSGSGGSSDIITASKCYFWERIVG